jgi:hypothetical protein
MLGEAVYLQIQMIDFCLYTYEYSFYEPTTFMAQQFQLSQNIPHLQSTVNQLLNCTFKK